MITDYRPVPQPVYEVIYNGTMEREWVRSRQRPAPPITRSQFARYGDSKQLVLAALRTKTPGRIWSVAQLTTLTGLSDSSIGTALRRLQREGFVCLERVDMGMGGAGAQIRVWLAS